MEGSPKDLKGNPGPEVETFLKVQYVMDLNFSPVDGLMSLRLVRIEPASANSGLAEMYNPWQLLAR